MTQSAYGADTVRDLKNFSGPGITFTISISIQPPKGTAVVALEEIPPVDWIVLNISDSGIWDLQNEKIKWGLFFDPSIPSIVSYDVTPLTEFNGEQCFNGFASFDGADQDIGGDRCIIAAIPTLSEWGVLISALFIVAFGIVFIQHRCPSPITLSGSKTLFWILYCACHLVQSSKCYDLSPDAIIIPIVTNIA